MSESPDSENLSTALVTSTLFPKCPVTIFLGGGGGGDIIPKIIAYIQSVYFKGILGFLAGT